MWKVIFTDVAEEDLLGASRYISEILKAPVAAENLLLTAEKEIGNLAEVPLSFPLVRDEYFAAKGVRFLLVKNYLVFYLARESENVVSILRFLYARRDWVSLLETKNEEKHVETSTDHSS